jgi:hypothetical protein
LPLKAAVRGYSFQFGGERVHTIWVKSCAIAPASSGTLWRRPSQGRPQKVEDSHCGSTTHSYAFFFSKRAPNPSMPGAAPARMLWTCAHTSLLVRGELGSCPPLRCRWAARHCCRARRLPRRLKLQCRRQLPRPGGAGGVDVAAAGGAELRAPVRRIGAGACPGICHGAVIPFVSCPKDLGLPRSMAVSLLLSCACCQRHWARRLAASKALRRYRRRHSAEPIRWRAAACRAACSQWQ